MGEFVRLEVDEASRVGTIRLDRPPMNALDIATQDELRELASEAARREDVRAVIIWGGEKVFAAGADIKEMRAHGPRRHGRPGPRALQDAFTAVARIPKPVVAAVTGYALGGGCELALCADFRIAADNAKLGQPEILLGFIPGAGGTQRLARLVGPSKAKDLIFTGRSGAGRRGTGDRSGRPGRTRRPRCTSRRTPGRRGWPRARRWRCGRPRRSSTPAWRPTSTPGCCWSARPSLAVRHRGRRRGHGLVRGQRPRQGHLQEPLARSASAARSGSTTLMTTPVPSSNPP